MATPTRVTRICVRYGRVGMNAYTLAERFPTEIWQCQREQTCANRIRRRNYARWLSQRAPIRQAAPR